MSQLGKHFLLFFLFPPQTSGECGGYVYPGKKFSVDLFPWPAQLMCSQDMSAGVEGWDHGTRGKTKFRGEEFCNLLGMESERKG